ncbi:fumarylacetoacetate hydrolase family protein [Geodermatophilus ruber]|uniref:2-keto-4-pentenoate hydratase/2-oxohepta-3-ene-1,7-dioic acid hydratase (Catechol pathway) n=1 Tax=Geodermatophilus ruber TaxID=504800 RepID=A0A1I4BZX6_9ACTN|nr:fumarylacetoacetate hydrolase family protein [Geodermatophilus ruber]SFK73461.1 2-keto-4-pentenoate hydratase/2-oxohepta-3-ene-1,7-dioic acid hydratase (catechol pathway) [Geodermatophilus ruber]
MRWVTYRSAAAGGERVGLVEDGQIHGLRAPDRLLDLLGDDGERMAGAAEEARRDPLEVVDLDEAVLRAPVPVPPSIRDFMAFEAHVRNARKSMDADLDPEWYHDPVFYFTNPAAVLGSGDDVPISPGCTWFDYELELGVVVGRGGADLDPAEAEEHIAGYFIFCDWSARDLQLKEMRQGLGPAKGKDGASTLGPMLVTPDELAPHRKGNGFDLQAGVTVNGRTYTKTTLGEQYWSFGEMLAYASRGTRLVPGDVIGSGTVGTGCILELSVLHGIEEYPWLRPGDEVVLSVELLGDLRARIVEGAPLRPLR